MPPWRNMVREGLSALPLQRFMDMVSDVYFELVRRYPEVKEAWGKALFLNWAFRLFATEGRQVFFFSACVSANISCSRQSKSADSCAPIYVALLGLAASRDT